MFVEKSAREFFTRTRSNRNVPQICIDPTALPDAFSANIPLARPGRCQSPLKELPEKRVNSVLDAAAQFRLQQKAIRIHNKIDNHGRDEALFQELAAALGYKENKLPFTLIAQRLPLKLLRENPEDSEAMLFGLAGFLEAPDLGVFKRSTREYVRKLWDRWWPHRDAMQRMILPANVWRMSSTRPLNHPQRRLAAMSMIVRESSGFRRCLNKAIAGGTPATTAEKFFSSLEHPFWNFHYTLMSEAAPKEMALIGESRVAEILANLLFPFWLRKMPMFGNTQTVCAFIESPAETAATRLFGNDPRRKQFLKPSCTSRLAPDLRGLLHAGQFRLRAMPVSRANAEVVVIR